MIQTQGTKPPQILYLARGTHELFAVVRSQVPPGFGLVTPDSDDPAEVFAKLPGADVVIVGTRKLDREMVTDETRSMIDAAALATMKRGAVLVNTARGPVVDQAKLVAALESGHLGAAGLDVYEQELLPAGHALAHFPNVVLTPHIAAATHDTFAAKMQGVFANIGRFHAGTPMQDQVL